MSQFLKTICIYSLNYQQAAAKFRASQQCIIGGIMPLLHRSMTPLHDTVFHWSPVMEITRTILMMRVMEDAVELKRHDNTSKRPNSQNETAFYLVNF